MNWIVAFHKPLLWGTAALACVLVCGCMKNKVLIKVNKDGSGRIIVTRVFTKETVETMAAQFQQMKQQMRIPGMEGLMKMPSDPFFDETAVKRDAKKFGAGVSFVKARKYEAGGARGYVALYSFKDINDVFLDMERLGSEAYSGMYGGFHTDFGNEEDMRPPEKGENSLEFRFTKGPVNKLQILIPNQHSDMAGGMDEEAIKEAEEQIKEETEAEEQMYGHGMGVYMDAETVMGNEIPAAFIGAFMGAGAQDEWMMRTMKGMAGSLAVEVAGADVKSTASHVEGKNKNRSVLFDFDADKMMASPKGKQLMRASAMRGMGSPEAMFGLTKNMPGFIMETNREVVVEFK